MYIQPIQHTYYYKRRRSALALLPHLLPTHSSHLLLYPFADTPQKVFQHIYSIDGKLPHEIICLFQLRPQTPVLSFQLLILLFQTLILVFEVQHLFKICLIPVTRVNIPEVIDKFFCKLRFLNRLIRILLDKCQLLLMLPNLTLFFCQVLLHFIQLGTFICQVPQYIIQFSVLIRDSD